MDKKYIIETKNLTKQYGSQKSVADLNIHVQRGRIYGLLGRNGAGKTTTMKMLLGLTKPTSGEVKIWGKALQGNEKKLLPRIGSLIESPGFYPNLTGTENLNIFARLRGVPQKNAVAAALEGQYPKGAARGAGNASQRNRRAESTADRGTGGFEEAAGHPLLGTESHTRHRRKQRAAQEAVPQGSLAG